jgi:GNAT superfamily N-acetyltransferase
VTRAIRPVEPGDRSQWARLYRAYAGSGGVSVSWRGNLGRLWRWLHDPAHPVEGAVCVNDGGTLIGLAHFRGAPEPISAVHVAFLDDLFVAPAWRRQGVATALLQHVTEAARARGWAGVRWMTMRDNAQARALYDRVAGPTKWVVYTMSPKEAG